LPGLPCAAFEYSLLTRIFFEFQGDRILSAQLAGQLAEILSAIFFLSSSLVLACRLTFAALPHRCLPLKGPLPDVECWRFFLTILALPPCTFIMPGGLHPPLSVIMTWSPNYINPETRGWGLSILSIVLIVIVYVVVGMRTYARFFMSRNAGIDDMLIIFNLVRLIYLVTPIQLC
jgi:hypothetical protein